MTDKQTQNTASRNTDPYSSHLAESDITTSGERQIQNDIALDVVILFPGLTSKELSEHCPLDRYQLARRLNDLFLQNKVDKTDGKHGEQKWYRGSGKILPTPETHSKPREAPLPKNNTPAQDRGAIQGLQGRTEYAKLNSFATSYTTKYGCFKCACYYRAAEEGKKCQICE